MLIRCSRKKTAARTANQRFRTGDRKFNSNSVRETDLHDAVDLHRVALAAGSGLSTASTTATIEAPAKNFMG